MQLIHPGRILKLRVRGSRRDLTQDTAEEEVCVVMPGVLARFDGSEIQVTIGIIVKTLSLEKKKKKITMLSLNKINKYLLSRIRIYRNVFEFWMEG